MEENDFIKGHINDLKKERNRVEELMQKARNEALQYRNLADNFTRLIEKLENNDC